MKKILFVLAAFFAAQAGTTARAETILPLTPQVLAHADAAAGKKRAEQCGLCHGKLGISGDPNVPHLAGQHAVYLATALDAYRGRLRSGVAMDGIVEGWSNADIVNVATYLAALPPFAEVPMTAAKVEMPAAVAEEDPFAQAKAAAQACAACHGEDGNSDVPGMPSVAGQPSEYIEAALKAYRDGQRVHDVMKAYTLSLSDPDIEMVSAYYAASKPTHLAEVPKGDLVAGATAAAECAGCHGADGNSEDPSLPRLAGLDAEYLAAAIKAYTEKTRDHAMMTELVEPLGDETIQNVAVFYATRKARPPAQPKRLSTEEWVSRCDRCHGVDGDSTNAKFPILTGQSAEYLVQALRVYHAGQRTNSTMNAMSFPLGEADFRNLAAHYAGKRRK